MSSSSSSGEPLTHLDSSHSGGFGTFSSESQYNNDGTRTATGFLYCTDDMYQLMNSQDPKIVRTKFGGLQKLAKELKTDLKNGICNESHLAHRMEAFGENRYPEPKYPTWLELFLEAFEDVALVILLVAALVALVAGVVEQVVLKKEEQGWIEGVAILITVLIIATVAATNDYSKDKQFRKLKEQTSDRKVRVIRDGAEHVISVFDVVVGDVVKLNRGDKIPADGLYIPGLEELMVDQSVLTGESDPQLKNTDSPFLFSGCFVTKGQSYMLVLAVGINSEWGRTLALVIDEHPPTPLQEKLEDLVILIGKVGIVVATLVFLVLLIYYIVDSVNPTAAAPCTWNETNNTCSEQNPYNWSNPNQCNPYCGAYDEVDGQPGWVWVPIKWQPTSLMQVLSSFIVAVTIVAVAVPEGLPLAVTISLAYSVKQMLDDNNLVRHLSACEVMGGATNICSDKTGTLTEGKMSVAECWIAGSPYRSSSEIVQAQMDSELHSLLVESFVLNNDDGELLKEPGKPVQFLGNPTECAMLIMAEKLGGDYKHLQSKYPPIKKWGFTSSRKRMSTIVSKDGYNRLYCKGAAEIVINMCNYYVGSDGVSHEAISDSLRKNLKNQIEGYARQGLRALTVAYRDFDSESTRWGDNKDGSGFEEDLILVGLVAIEDPLRPEVPDSVLRCQRAGIMVRMVTGDNILTARKIASDCHILTPEGTAMEGPAFEQLSDHEALDILPTLQVLARSRPQDKLRLVELLTNSGEVVAVTGDGTNDAPALSAASVGLAMGIAGTEVAKNAADIIILDDNFASIVKSVLWGRCIYDNIRKFLQFQLTVNVVALVIAFFGAVTKFGTPLTAVQLLWVNLIMDTMAALALGTEKPTDNLLLRRPYGKHGKLITPIMIRNILGQSAFQLVVLFTILYAVKNGWHLIFPGVPSGKEAADRGEPSVHYTILFNSFVFCQIFNEINSRKVNSQKNVFEGIFTNWIFIGVILVTIAAQILIVEFGGTATKTLPLSWAQWGYCIAIGVVSLPVGFLLRFIPVKLEDWEVEDGSGLLLD